MSSGNLTSTERWVSTLAGFGLIPGAAVRGSWLRRLAFTAGGASLLSRGLVGYCGMKAAFTGEADSFGSGLREQWERMRSQAGAGAAGIDTLEALQLQGMQELASGTAQLAHLLDELERGIGESELQSQVRSYSTQLHSRAQDLERILAGRGASVRRHPHQAMQALAAEARKTMRVATPTVRDAALIDSLQRLIHYQIAAEGSAAAHAKALGRVEDAGRLAEWADRDKAVDAALTELAKGLINPRAAAREAAGTGAAAGARSQTGATPAGGAGAATGPGARPH